MSYETHNEQQQTGLASKLNWLRAGVLGANDGIVSTAGVVVGVAAAGSSSSAIFTAGVAAVAAGAVSMALGEYVSVSAQRDTEDILVKEHREAHSRDRSLEEKDIITSLLELGMSEETAHRASQEMTSDQRLAGHLRLELGLDEEDLTSPWSAAAASAVAFVSGALLPLFAAILVPASMKIAVIITATLLALAITGTISAHLSEAHRSRSVARLVIGGALALTVTFIIGWLFGTTVAG
ncbi:VIT1/CCC1 transporter family protein [Corynebacterium anserum]|uniref:VIT family protein n=1 Tax=Corynebacterium anserum TaxID=2684406 RepID=A0A7G7YNT7_9CORY|nr:VIT1/CCC1 transporter family protein [Corynebacterium anserum]MBC2681749.1 VIT family protein [Corynebacterium anserum]QNH96157.1 VIT family protein [Corynebacterium anserum]